jgi:hypothetical protein
MSQLELQNRLPRFNSGRGLQLLLLHDSARIYWSAAAFKAGPALLYALPREQAFPR